MPSCHSCHGFVTSLQIPLDRRCPRLRPRADPRPARRRRAPVPFPAAPRRAPSPLPKMQTHSCTPERDTESRCKANCIVTGAATGAPLINARSTGPRTVLPISSSRYRRARQNSGLVATRIAVWKSAEVWRFGYKCETGAEESRLGTWEPDNLFRGEKGRGCTMTSSFSFAS